MKENISRSERKNHMALKNVHHDASSLTEDFISQWEFQVIRCAKPISVKPRNIWKYCR
jgi:hypothetical protein